jgi:uncharacterized membrane protein
VKRVVQIIASLLFSGSLFSQNFVLEVSGGFDSGNFPAGDSVHVFADKTPDG